MHDWLARQNPGDQGLSLTVKEYCDRVLSLLDDDSRIVSVQQERGEHYLYELADGLAECLWSKECPQNIRRHILVSIPDFLRRISYPDDDIFESDVYMFWHWLLAYVDSDELLPDVDVALETLEKQLLMAQPVLQISAVHGLAHAGRWVDQDRRSMWIDSIPDRRIRDRARMDLEAEHS